MDEQRDTHIFGGASGKALGKLGQSPRDVPSGDTFTGQVMHLDEIIKCFHGVLERVTKLADHLTPDITSTAPDPHPSHMPVSKISPGPDSGPLLFRLQNRTSELHALQSSIHRVISRVEQVL